MYQRIQTAFVEHSILTADLLNTGFDQLTQIINGLTSDYSDGILSGSEIKIKGNLLAIQPGVIRFQKQLYCLIKEYELPYQAMEEEQYLYVRFWEKTNMDQMECYLSEVILSSKKPSRATDLELARFLLKEGAVLRDQYNDFGDLLTKHNTINRIHAKYSSMKDSSIWQKITTLFGEGLLACQLSDPMDAAFAMDCIKGKVLPFSEIEAYVKYKLKKEVSDREDKESLIRDMSQILQLVKNNRVPGRNEPRRKMFVE